MGALVAFENSVGRFRFLLGDDPLVVDAGAVERARIGTKAPNKHDRVIGIVRIVRHGHGKKEQQRSFRDGVYHDCPLM